MGKIENAERIVWRPTYPSEIARLEEAGFEYIAGVGFLEPEQDPVLLAGVDTPLCEVSRKAERVSDVLWSTVRKMLSTQPKRPS